MCGIAGIIGPGASKETIQHMLEKQVHRGPDHSGMYVNKNIAAIGHNRLSIIDLSNEANEPFIDNSGRYYLTFNGEIYNFKELKVELSNFYNFKTSSDTEVLLASYLKWGKSCLNKFRGMFALAIWDSKNQELFAARDRFGVKPFFYTRYENDFYFSSEIKALKFIPGGDLMNEKVWAGYFCYGTYGMPNETFYKQVYQLPAGHSLNYANGSMKIQKWYHFESEVNKIPVSYSFEQAKEKYLKLLQESIMFRFRADVSAGFNISGGVDSSLLLALVNQFQGSNIRSAYTFYTGDERYDELPWVEQMISKTKNPLIKVRLSAEEVKNKIHLLSDLQDEPFGGIPTIAYSKIFECAHKNGIKVLLDGQGMDEQWAGYDYYLKKENFENTIQGINKDSPFRKKVLNKKFAALAEKTSYPKPFDNELQNTQYRDLFYTKIPRALRFNDRISMAYGVELREPFLDHKLVEFSFAMPEAYKINNKVGKYMLREILKPLVSRDLAYTPKRPLQTPQREWLGNDLKEFVTEELLKLKFCKYSNWFNHKEIAKEWKIYQNGSNNSSFHIWQWINAAQLLK